MKKIIISLILLLTCQQVFAQNRKPWVSIKEHTGNSAQPRTEVTVDATLCPETPRSFGLVLRYTYLFQNDANLRYERSTEYNHVINFTPGQITTHALYWRRPSEATMNEMRGAGFFEPVDGPHVRVDVIDRSSYNTVEGSGSYENGPRVPEGNFNNVFDDHPDYFIDAMLYLGALWSASETGSTPPFRRNLSVKYGIREDISNHRRPKTKVTFNATMYKRGVSMEHYFMLSHKYIYTSTTQPKSIALTIDSMVQAFIPTGKVVSGTVDYPEVPFDKRYLYFWNNYKLTAIKVTMKTPFLVLGSGNNRDEYSNGPGYNTSDGNKWDDHVYHTWDAECTHPSHVSKPYVNGTNGLFLNVVRTRVNP